MRSRAQKYTQIWSVVHNRRCEGRWCLRGSEGGGENLKRRLRGGHQPLTMAITTCVHPISQLRSVIRGCWSAIPSIQRMARHSGGLERGDSCRCGAPQLGFPCVFVQLKAERRVGAVMGRVEGQVSPKVPQGAKGKRGHRCDRKRVHSLHKQLTRTGECRRGWERLVNTAVSGPPSPVGFPP